MDDDDSTRTERSFLYSTLQEMALVVAHLVLKRRSKNEQEDDGVNCRLVIPSNETAFVEPNSVVVSLELIVATSDISVSELLRLNLPSSGTAIEEALLQKELKRMRRIPSKAFSVLLAPGRIQNGGTVRTSEIRSLSLDLNMNSSF